MGRIVVNFDPSQAPARRKPRRWLRVLALLALVVALIVIAIGVGGFLWWRNFQSTPVYSLALLLDAAQKGDTTDMGRLLDRDEIVRNMTAKVSQKAVSRYGALATTAAQQQIENSVISLPNLNQTIGTEVVSEMQSLAADQPQTFAQLLLALRSLATITTEGDQAKASAKLGNRTIALTMRRDADRWRVTSFDDDVVVQRIVDSVTKDLPPIGALDSANPLFKMPRKPRKKRR